MAGAAAAAAMSDGSASEMLSDRVDVVEHALEELADRLREQVRVLQQEVDHLKQRIDSNPPTTDITNILRGIAEERGQGRAGKFDETSAEKLVPDIWCAKAPWREFRLSTQNWVSALNHQYLQILNQAEDPKGDIISITNQDEEIQEFSRKLHRMLVKATTGGPRVFVENAGLGEGLLAWRELSSWYDHKTVEDKPEALERSPDQKSQVHRRSSHGRPRIRADHSGI